MQAQDGVYARRPWTDNTPQVQRPNSSYEDQVTAAALASQMEMPPEAIRDIRPPIPIDPFPPKFGYPVDAIGIEDLIDLNTRFKRADFSGRQSGYSGTSYPALGVQ